MQDMTSCHGKDVLPALAKDPREEDRIAVGEDDKIARTMDLRRACVALPTFRNACVVPPTSQRSLIPV